MNVDYSKYGVEVVHEKVGEGGSAYIHKGKISNKIDDYYPEEGIFVAIKEYKENILHIPNQSERIKQEGEIGKKIEHDNIVKIFNYNIEDGGDCFLIMEWIDGKTLNDWELTLRKNVAWERLRSISSQIILAIKELHRNNIYHRDVKPENVMVVNDVVKLMDVGIAEITGDNDHTLHTSVKDFVGSVRYSSPQFILGEEFDPKDDVYSLGATFLELFSGKQPYSEIIRKPVLPIIVTQGPPRVGDFRENVPACMKVLVEGCLNRDRSRRPTLQEIEEVFEKEGQSAYIQRELKNQEADGRGYKIINLDSTGGGFFADIGSDTPQIGIEYTVVRQEKPLAVPSLNIDVVPEMWVASAELRHIQRSVGHFKLIGKRWVDGKFQNYLDTLGASGHWEEYDKKSVQVKAGDYVLRK